MNSHALFTRSRVLDAAKAVLKQHEELSKIISQGELSVRAETRKKWQAMSWFEKMRQYPDDEECFIRCAVYHYWMSSGDQWKRHQHYVEVCERLIALARATYDDIQLSSEDAKVLESYL